MEIHAEGKNIPTYQFGGLFVQGEQFAEVIYFMVDRYYHDYDLAGAQFCMRGLTEDGWEIQQSLHIEETGEETIKLRWRVGSDFTLNAGRLSLELRADMDDYLILKYIMQPVMVRPTINGQNGPLPETVEQVIQAINEAATQGLEDIQSAIDSFDISEVQERIETIIDQAEVIISRPEVIPMKRSEYIASEHKQNALYVITEEDV